MKICIESTATVCYILNERYPDTFGVLPSRDSEIRGATVRMAKTNAILKHPVNKLFPNENTYQEPTKWLWQGSKS